jgi:uncharacterized membrane protein YhfC
MRYALLIANYALMVGMPLALGLYLRHRLRLPWRIWFIGAGTFIISQIGHIPFNQIVLGIWEPEATTLGGQLLYFGFLGVSAGIFEEPARYLAYRFAARDARSWGKGIMLGAGHGGIEAILVGLLAAVNTLVLLTLAENGGLEAVVPAEQMGLVEIQLAAIETVPAYQLLFGALERLFAIILHLALSVLVLQVFLRGQHRWLLAAIGLHTMANGLLLLATTRVGVVAGEATLGAIALLCLFIIFRLRTPEKWEPEPEPLPEPQLQERPRLTVDREKLDDSRYL